MRKLLLILSVFISLTVSSQTTWYISSSGNDGTGAGTIDNPWRTLYKACTDPDVSEGDFIYVLAGTYTISVQIPWPDGVTIVGEGMYRSMFNCSVPNGPAIKGESYGHSGDTNFVIHSISYCGFNGNLTGY